MICPKPYSIYLRGTRKLSGLRSHRRGQAGRDEVKRTTRGEAPRALRDKGLGFGVYGLIIGVLGFRV